MRPNFAECAQDFIQNARDRYPQYIYNGTDGLAQSGAQPTLITLDGCKKLCGTGTEYYEWYTFLSKISVVVFPPG